jgi:phage terminase large subunit
VEGAIYFDEVAAAEAQGRIREVPYDPLLKVHTIWDLGWNDATTIILVQRSASEIRVIDYIEGSHRTLADYAQQLNGMGFNWGTDWLPHDAYAKDVKTGKSAVQIINALGRNAPVSRDQIPELGIEDGIRAARIVFPRIYFDKTKAARLIECLKRYRRHISQATNEPGAPLHDEYSHGADAFRYLCVTADHMGNAQGFKPITYTNRRNA